MELNFRQRTRSVWSSRINRAIDSKKKKNNVNAFHGNEWIKKHVLYKAETPCQRSRRQKICFLISISAVILKLMVKITSIFGSYRFLRIAWHDILSLSHHLLASWNLYIPRVAESKSKKGSWVKKGSWIEIQSPS